MNIATDQLNDDDVDGISAQCINNFKLCISPNNETKNEMKNFLLTKLTGMFAFPTKTIRNRTG